MSDPIVAPKKANEAAVVDIRNGDWKFGYKGTLIKASLFNKVGLLEQTSNELLVQIQREIGEDPRDIASLLVALHSSSMNTKALYVKSLCERVVSLEEERAMLARAAKGFNDQMVYVISIEDMKAFGL